ncbi:UNVERIFIED_ORG: DGQHR domain-containing protein [Paenarthrobacter nicotinovorans]
MTTKAKPKTKRKTLSDAERKQRREQSAFARRIRTTFTNAGFISLPTSGKEKKFGNKTGELDHVFVYENIVLVCEDTIEKSPRRHLKNKKLLFDEIASNKEDFITWLHTEFKDKFADLAKYSESRYKVFFLYFSKNDFILSEDDVKLFAPVRIVDYASLGYFHKMAQNIKFSSRTDILRYLGLAKRDIGSPSSAADNKTVPATIIYPSDNTGFKQGVRVVSFMMSAETLLNNCYVLRKDNWEDSRELYQRLIEKDRIQSIRRYLATRQSTFINNIIVSLPEGVEFRDAQNRPVDTKAIDSFTPHKMLLPDEFNSICVIDGQHRIFAHYEGVDAHEASISKIRDRLHLLVTGLIFPAKMTSLEKRKFESELFLDINSNSRPVPADVLLTIETLKDPFSDLGVARRVLEQINKKAPFESKFQLGSMDAGKIKIASIIKFALRYAVDIIDDPDKPSLFNHWETPAKRKQLLQDRREQRDDTLLEEYIKFAAGTLTLYFNAIQSRFKADWENPDSRILSTTSINGFIIALRRSLPKHGVLQFSDYRAKFESLQTDFSKDGFPYTSSQYVKYSKVILSDAFDVKETQDASSST